MNNSEKVTLTVFGGGVRSSKELNADGTDMFPATINYDKMGNTHSVHVPVRWYSNGSVQVLKINKEALKADPSKTSWEQARHDLTIANVLDILSSIQGARVTTEGVVRNGNTISSPFFKLEF